MRNRPFSGSNVVQDSGLDPVFRQATSGPRKPIPVLPIMAMHHRCCGFGFVPLGPGELGQDGKGCRCGR